MITVEMLNERRDALVASLLKIQGAIEALEELIEADAPPTVDEFINKLGVERAEVS